MTVIEWYMTLSHAQKRLVQSTLKDKAYVDFPEYHEGLIALMPPVTIWGALWQRKQYLLHCCGLDPLGIDVLLGDLNHLMYLQDRDATQSSE